MHANDLGGGASRPPQKDWGGKRNFGASRQNMAPNAFLAALRTENEVTKTVLSKSNETQHNHPNPAIGEETTENKHFS